VFSNLTLTTVESVLSLIKVVEERSDLAALIKLRYGRHIISWSEYFFNLTDYAELYQHLLSHGQFRGSHNQKWPIAMAVKINPREPRLTRFGNWQLYGRTSPCTPGHRLGPVMYFRERELAYRMSREPYVLICALPTLRDFRQPEKPWLQPCADVELEIINSAQICPYSPTLLP
jgi:hypothetical protein